MKESERVQSPIVQAGTAAIETFVGRRGAAGTNGGTGHGLEATGGRTDHSEGGRQLSD